jgi:glutamate-ammonia-ligase adenylyltransferase
LARLADRKLLTETELTKLFEAYDFLRRIEHRLQMENGLQTHLVPNELTARFLLAKRVNFNDLNKFDNALKLHAKNVNQIFSRVFNPTSPPKLKEAENSNTMNKGQRTKDKGQKTKDESLKLLSEISPHFAEMLTANPSLIDDLPDITEDFANVTPSSRRLSGERPAHLSKIHESAGRTLDSQRDAGVTEKSYYQLLLSAVQATNNFANELAVLRKTWTRFLLEIVVFDVFEKITLQESKNLQTNLAEASIEVALFITRRELERRLAIKIDDFPFAVLGLGKLGGGGIDYGSDLDLILIYDEEKTKKARTAQNDFSSSLILHPSSLLYSRAVEIFVTTLSSLTRDGHLYRVDLRLRPDGKNGATSISKIAFLNYLENRSAIWEWLAYVKLRGVAGDLDLATSTENEARKIIHENARQADVQELKDETWRVRKRLEEEKSAIRKGKEIDIKFGAGGMLDIYFAMRFLQLRDNVPDDAANRSTFFMLNKLHEKNSLSTEDLHIFKNGYEFLSELDHHLRLTVGRSPRLPIANQTALQTIVKRMKLASIKDLLEQLTFYRLNIRASFENIVR